MPIWEQLGMMGAGTALGAIFQNANDRRQLTQQEKLQQMQIRGSKELTDYNTQKQMEMWQNTNYPAQVAMMKKAGLNPALLYGQGGGGGATANISQGQVTGAEAPKGGGELGMATQMGLQLALQQAQIENIKADTENKKATTPKIGAETENIKADTNSKIANTALTNINTELNKLNLAFEQQTFENRKSIINLSLSKLIEEVKIIENDRTISDATINDKIKTIGEQLKNIIQDNLYKDSQTAKTWKEKSEIESRIKLLDQQWNINSIDEEMAKDGMNPKAGNLLKLFHNMLRGIGQWFQP